AAHGAHQEREVLERLGHIALHHDRRRRGHDALDVSRRPQRYADTCPVQHLPAELLLELPEQRTEAAATALLPRDRPEPDLGLENGTIGGPRVGPPMSRGDQWRRHRSPRSTAGYSRSSRACTARRNARQRPPL